jgi:hypothetical protein
MHEIKITRMWIIKLKLKKMSQFVLHKLRHFLQLVYKTIDKNNTKK